MDRTAREAMHQDINDVFNYSPPPLSVNLKFASRQPRLDIRPSFYDKHLDEHLMLKRVVRMPSIISDISNSVDRALRLLEEQKIELPLSRGTTAFSSQKTHASMRFKEPTTSAASIAEAYQYSTAAFCAPIASMLRLSPRAPRWQSILIWRYSQKQRFDSYDVWDADFGLQLLDFASDREVPRDIQESIAEQTLQILRHAREKYPDLAVWDIFPISGEIEEALKDMDGVSSSSIFPHDQCTAITGITSLPSTIPRALDAETTPWGSPFSSFGDMVASSTALLSALEGHEDLTLSGRQTKQNDHIHSKPVLSKKATKVPKTNIKLVDAAPHNWPSIAIPVIKSREKRSPASLLLQRAWSRAVHRDSTFIILSCGNFERIGFRHRASQTLFLSDLIDVPHCRDPGYGKIHAGLYISIIHDVLDRVAATCKLDADTQNKGRKRRRMTESSVGTIRKRPNTRAAIAMKKAVEVEKWNNFEIYKEEAENFQVALIYIRYESYNSRVPATFLRSEQPYPRPNVTYSPRRYISLVITSEIAAGATGFVHGATLEFLDPDNKARNFPVVVKFAFKPKEQQRMRHEFSIYRHLSSSGVSGVPTAFGLFEDVESDALALIMTHVGSSLATLYPQQLQVVISDPERSGFLRVLNDLHNAGVHHRDLRQENLMIDDDGNVYIIDFDRAKLYPTDEAKENELLHLTDLLDGHYLPPDDISTESTSESVKSEW